MSDLKRSRGTRILYLSEACKVFQVSEAQNLKADIPKHQAIDVLYFYNCNTLLQNLSVHCDKVEAEG